MMRTFSAKYRRRQKLVLGSVLLLILLFCYGYVRTVFAILIQGPFISRWQSDHLRLSNEKDGFDITLSSYPSQPTVDVDRSLPVPPILHHILLGSSSRRNETLLDACRESCLSMHPQYEYRFWNDGNAEEFVAREFPGMLDTWNSYRYRIQKVDTLRYMVLYAYGGICLDLDLQCLRPLDPLRRFNFVAVAANPTGISNGFLMVSPRHPFLENVIQNLPRYNINWLGLPYATVMFSTGCHFLSTLHALFPNRDDLRILWGPRRLHRLSGAVTTPLFRHFGLSSWHSFDGPWLTSGLPLLIFLAAFVTSTVGFVVLSWMKYRTRSRRMHQLRPVEII